MHPILFHIGSFPVRAYGVMVVLGFALGMWRIITVCRYRMATEPEGSPRRVHPDTVMDTGLGLLFAGIIGARLLYVALDWKSYAANPLSILQIWSGGLSLHGSLLFGVLWLIYFCRRKRVSVLVVGDLAATCFAIAYAFGRIGCLLNGCCYGGICDLPWGVHFPDETHPGQLTPPSHPVQLYAFILHLAFFGLLALYERKKRRDGEIFYGYIALYGVYRYAMEHFRAGVTSTYLIPSLHLTDTHVISAIMVVGGIAGVLWLRKTRKAYSDAVPMPFPFQKSGSPTLAKEV